MSPIIEGSGRHRLPLETLAGDRRYALRMTTVVDEDRLAELRDEFVSACGAYAAALDPFERRYIFAKSLLDDSDLDQAVCVVLEMAISPTLDSDDFNAFGHQFRGLFPEFTNEWSRRRPYEFPFGIVRMDGGRSKPAAPDPTGLGGGTLADAAAKIA